MSPSQLTTATATLQLAAAVVIHKDQVLLVRRSKTEGFMPGVWGVPCGKLDPIDRSLEAAAVRELREETRLEGIVLAQAASTEFRSIWQGQPAINIQHNYLMKLTGIKPLGTPDVRPPLKDQDSKWVPVNRIDDAGLDEHNLRSVHHVLSVWSRPLGPADWCGRELSTASTSSSWRR